MQGCTIRHVCVCVFACMCVCVFVCVCAWFICIYIRTEWRHVHDMPRRQVQGRHGLSCVQRVRGRQVFRRGCCAIVYKLPLEFQLGGGERCCSRLCLRPWLHRCVCVCVVCVCAWMCVWGVCIVLRVYACTRTRVNVYFVCVCVCVCVCIFRCVWWTSSRSPSSISSCFLCFSCMDKLKIPLPTFSLPPFSPLSLHTGSNGGECAAYLSL